MLVHCLLDQCLVHLDVFVLGFATTLQIGSRCKRAQGLTQFFVFGNRKRWT